jgi:kynurenine formamidase
MHNTTHIDAPAHVVQGTPFIDEVPLPHFFGSGIVVSIPKKKWEAITYDDLEKAAGSVVRPRDVVIVNTGWHKVYEDNEDYFCRAPGFVPSAGEWFVEKKVKVVGHDTQANDHPLATAIGPQRNGPLHPHLAAGAAHSRCSRGIGSAATAASSGSWPSSTQRVPIASSVEKNSDASQTSE